MKWIRRLLLFAVIALLVCLALAGRYYYAGFYRPIHRNLPNQDQQSFLADAEKARLRQLAAGQRSYLSLHKFNTRLCFLVDMQLPSGKNRFFVFDLDNDSVLLAGLVAHGSGNSGFSFRPSFSNRTGSSCTSLGKYRIGYPYTGQFGHAYKLYGLDSTNNNAFARNVVLHSYTVVPEDETDPLPIANSRGCAMVAPGFLKQLGTLIDGSKEPILLYIVD